MLNVTDVQVTAPATSDQRDCLSTPLVMTPLRIPRRKHMPFHYVLQALKVFYTRHRPVEDQLLHHDYQPWETPTDRLARTEPYVYIHSISR
jgi:hypothetical protein